MSSSAIEILTQWGFFISHCHYLSYWVILCMYINYIKAFEAKKTLGHIKSHEVDKGVSFRSCSNSRLAFGMESKGDLQSFKVCWTLSHSHSSWKHLETQGRSEGIGSTVAMQRLCTMRVRPACNVSRISQVAVLLCPLRDKGYQRSPTCLWLFAMMFTMFHLHGCCIVLPSPLHTADPCHAKYWCICPAHPLLPGETAKLNYLPILLWNFLKLSKAVAKRTKSVVSHGWNM